MIDLHNVSEALTIVTVVVNSLLVVVGHTIKRELHHINSSIEHVKDLTTMAQASAAKAHERIDALTMVVNAR